MWQKNDLKITKATFRMVCVSIALLCSTTLFGQTKKWVGTWSCAPYAAGTNTPPSPYLANNTLRQIVRVSIGGDSLRIKFSNITSATPVTLNAVNIAVSPDGTQSAVDAATITPLTFNKSTSVTMAAKSTVTSDPIAFPLTPNMRLAITIYYGQCQTASNMTHHYGSRTNSYILSGNQTTNAAFTGATTVERWYTINTVDVLAPNTTAAVAVLGNSITDGYGLHDGLQNRWTDVFSQRLNNNAATDEVGVLNLGIGGTNVTTSGVSRFQQDILDQSGLRWLIVFYGVNDIGGNVPATTIINTYKKMIGDAHAQNIRVYGATITPFNGNAYFSPAHEATRGEVNKWIRTKGNFDRCLDFDKAVRDPNDTTKLLAIFSNDWLHPNIAGYKALGESIDLGLFTGGDTVFVDKSQLGTESLGFEAERFVTATSGTSFNTVSDAGASNGKYITVQPGLNSSSSAPIGDANAITIPFTAAKDSTYYVFARLNCPTANDDSFWVKMDDGAFVMCNGLGTSGWQWLQLLSYDIKAGSHTLTIAYREDGALLDKLCISNYNSMPKGMGVVDPIVTTVNSPQQVRGFSLGANYPNPFKTKTNIPFEVPCRVFVSLKVFNVVGIEVAQLVGDVCDGGAYVAEFNADDLPLGVYFYVMRSGNFSASRKVIHG
jgi:lysophospholipase L1-like esterase